MGDWALYDGQGCETAGVASGSSTGATVTAAASANTKGAWTELTAATARDVTALLTNTRKAAATIDLLVDIGIGAAGSEQVLIPNLKADGGGGSLHRDGPTLWPVSIPRGTRIAARCQATTASSTVRVQCLLFASSWLGAPGLSRVTDYGTNTADSGGVSIDPGGTAHTKGAWAQLTAATTNPVRAIVVGIGNQANASRTAADWLLDIGIGSAGSEQVIVADMHAEASTVDDQMIPAIFGPIPVNLPAGTRLAARAQCSITDGTDRLFDVIVYGID